MINKKYKNIVKTLVQISPLLFVILGLRIREYFRIIFNQNKTTYLAGYMEAAMESCEKWRDKITPVLQELNIIVQDPTKNEAEKLGMPVELSREKLYGLKRSGKREEFLKIVNMIFDVDLKQVAQCSFLIVYYKNEIKTVGTIGEMQIATLLGIPIYLISPDRISDFNSWLLGMVLINDGEIFRTPNECTNYIREKYFITKERKETSIGFSLTKE